MQSSALLPLLLFLAALVAAAGCSADPTEEAHASPAGDAAALIAPEALAGYVPEAPQGWRLTADPAAAVLEEDGASIASVTASYVSGDGATIRTADLAIQDTGGRPVGLRRLADDLAAVGANGTAPAQTVLGGRPAYVVDNGDVAGAYIVVADRFVVWLAVAGGTRADLDGFVAAIDLDALAGLR